MTAPDLPYLQGYAPDLLAQVRRMVEEGRLGPYLAEHYPESHDIRTEAALFDAAQDLKQRFMKNAPPLHRVRFDPKLQVVRDALGLHSRRVKLHGGRWKATSEIRVDTVFREAPAAFLQMILVHELAHFREGEHSKAFYQLCTHMAPDYFQLEFDLRLYLTHQAALRASEAGKKPNGPGPGAPRKGENGGADAHLPVQPPPAAR